MRRIYPFLVAVFAATSVTAQTSSPFRYDDDLSAYLNGSPQTHLYETLKYVRLGSDRYHYVSFGADLRERIESSNVQLVGLRYWDASIYDLHRLLVYGDLHFNQFRLFVQLGEELEAGRKPEAVPTDVDRGDLAQGFADYRVALANQDLTVRAGRFEMSFDDGALIGLRDGPNVRQTWQGGRAIYRFMAGQLDVFAVEPVNVVPGWFDDQRVHGESLWGAHLDMVPWTTLPLQLNAFYYGSTAPKVALVQGAGAEHTHTFGLRGRAEQGRFDGSVGGIVQTGTFANHDLRSWSSHADLGWSFQQALWQPRVGVRADVLSGGHEANGTVHTFNPLYPNDAFSTEATIEAPANLIQSGLTVDLRPLKLLSVQHKIEGLWRYSLDDAFYAAPTFALVAPTSQSGGRYSGTEQQLRASSQVDRFVNLTAAFVHFDPAPFLRASRAISESFGMAEVSVHL